MLTRSLLFRCDIDVLFNFAVNVARDVKAFALEAQKYLSKSDRISIKAKLEIIYDPKYKDGTSDDEMKDAIASVKLVLESLAKNSRLKEERINKSVKKIETVCTMCCLLFLLLIAFLVIPVSTRHQRRSHQRAVYPATVLDWPRC